MTPQYIKSAADQKWRVWVNLPALRLGIITKKDAQRMKWMPYVPTCILAAFNNKRAAEKAFARYQENHHAT